MPTRRFDICGRRRISAMSSPRGVLPGEIDLQAFSEHLRACRCPRAKGGRHNHHTIYGAEALWSVPRGDRVCRSAASAAPAELQLVTGFKAWLRKTRSVRRHDQALRARRRRLATALGEDPANWDAAGNRRTFMDRASTSGRGAVEKMTTGVRDSCATSPSRAAAASGSTVRFPPMPTGSLPTCRGICRRST